MQYVIPYDIWILIASNGYQIYALLYQINNIFKLNMKILEPLYIQYHTIKSLKYNNNIFIETIKCDFGKTLIKFENYKFCLFDIQINDKIEFNEIKTIKDNIVITIHINDILKYMIHNKEIVIFPIRMYGRFIDAIFIYEGDKRLLENMEDDHNIQNIDNLIYLVQSQTGNSLDECQIALHLSDYDVVYSIINLTDSLYM